MNKLVSVKKKNGNLIIRIDKEEPICIYGKITASVHDPLLIQVAEIKGVCINDLVRAIENLEKEEK